MNPKFVMIMGYVNNCLWTVAGLAVLVAQGFFIWGVVSDIKINKLTNNFLKTR